MPANSRTDLISKVKKNLSHSVWFAALVLKSLSAAGPRETSRKVWNRLRARISRRRAGYALRDGARLPLPTMSAPALLTPRVLLIAEVSIPQCLKYRVTQKSEMIQLLGYDCSILSWRDTEACLNALQTHSMVIFYRVPGYDNAMHMIAEAKALRVPTFWEVDDIIFDSAMYLTNANLQDLSAFERRGLQEGVVLYRKAMAACEGLIASTQGVAEAMSAAGSGQPVHLIENAFDAQTLALAERINAREHVTRDVIRIVYGSGTKTHDADFRVAAGALNKILRERPNVRLCLAGDLTLPSTLEAFESQIEWFPKSDYATYLNWLADGDINLAPLEKNVFNDAKSNIKLLEAAAVKVPSVCSPAKEFEAAITQGRTGLLADTTQQWYEAIMTLIDDPAMRVGMGNQVHDELLMRYRPEMIAATRVKPLLETMRRKPKALRVLGVNVYFSPQSFGGATVVAEEMAKRLNSFEGVEYAMFTSLRVDRVPAYELTRYESDGVPVFGVGLPLTDHLGRANFENKNVVAPFQEVLRSYKPDVVHLHSIQGIGAEIAAACIQEGVRFAITLHDAWWICGRQFMINNKKRYCGQRSIDLSICASCVPDAELNADRQHKLARVLSQASLLLAPSAFFRQLYIDNGISPDRIVVHKNGITPPRTAALVQAPSEHDLVRFGYVGGNSDVKGIHLVKKAFGELRRANYQLLIVDNALNLGRVSIRQSDWSHLRGEVQIVPAYTQESIDAFFSEIDVLLFPTQWKESFGLTVREASIRDKWVIATDAGGVIEDILPGQNGDIIPLSDDGTVLKEKIEALLLQPERLRAFVNPAKEGIRLFDEQAVELRDCLQRLKCPDFS